MLEAATLLFLILYAGYSVYTVRFQFRDPMGQPLRFTTVWFGLLIATSACALVLVAAVGARSLLAGVLTLAILAVVIRLPSWIAWRNSQSTKQTMLLFYESIARVDEGRVNPESVFGPVSSWASSLDEPEYNALAADIASAAVRNTTKADARLLAAYEKAVRDGFNEL